MADVTNRTLLAYDASDEYRPEPPLPPEIPAWKDGSLRIGIHTSIAGEITRALEISHGLGANALQIFSCSPRMWTLGASRIGEVQASQFRNRRRELNLGPLVIHANYLINLASANPVLRTRSIQAFHQEIVRAIALSADYLVVHPGSCGKDGRADAGVLAVAQGIKHAARGLKLGDLRLLIENTAGQGNCLGSRFEELAGILVGCRELPLGVCIDTAHLFAAGWDIRSAEGLDRTLTEIDRAFGLDRIYVVHTNDSKTALGSRVDRHEHIGQGKIGLDTFRRILAHPRLSGRAFILETPLDKPGDDLRNVANLWKLAGRDVVATGADGMKPRRRKPAKKQKPPKASAAPRKKISTAKRGK